MRFYTILIPLCLASNAYGKTLKHIVYAEEKPLNSFNSDSVVSNSLMNWTKKDEYGRYLVGDKEVSEVKRQACEFLRIKKCKIEISPIASKFKISPVIDIIVVAHKPTGIRQLVHLPTGRRLQIQKDVDTNNIHAQRMHARQGSKELLLVHTQDAQKANHKIYLVYEDKTEEYNFNLAESDPKVPGVHRLVDEVNGDKALAYNPDLGILYKGVNLEKNLGEYVQFREPAVERATSAEKPPK